MSSGELGPPDANYLADDLTWYECGIIEWQVKQLAGKSVFAKNISSLLRWNNQEIVILNKLYQVSLRFQVYFFLFHVVLNFILENGHDIQDVFLFGFQGLQLL